MKNIKQYESHNDLTFPIKVRFPQQLHGSVELKAAWGNDTSQREALLPAFHGMLSHDGKDSAAKQAEAALPSRLVLSQALISLLFVGSLSCLTHGFAGMGSCGPGVPPPQRCRGPSASVSSPSLRSPRFFWEGGDAFSQGCSTEPVMEISGSFTRLNISYLPNSLLSRAA